MSSGKVLVGSGGISVGSSEFRRGSGGFWRGSGGFWKGSGGFWRGSGGFWRGSGRFRRSSGRFRWVPGGFRLVPVGSDKVLKIDQKIQFILNYKICNVLKNRRVEVNATNLEDPKSLYELAARPQLKIIHFIKGLLKVQESAI